MKPRETEASDAARRIIVLTSQYCPGRDREIAHSIGICRPPLVRDIVKSEVEEVKTQTYSWPTSASGTSPITDTITQDTFGNRALLPHCSRRHPGPVPRLLSRTHISSL